MKTKPRRPFLIDARRHARDAARTVAKEAKSATERAESRYLRILVRHAFSLLDETRRLQFFSEAMALGSGAQLATMRAAIAALLADDRGTRGGVGIEMRVLCGEVFARGVLVPLSRSEFAIVIALARKPRPYSVVELGDLLYPELDADNAANRLRVYVHRIRRRLGRDAIVAEGAGYRLGPTVGVDTRTLVEIEGDLGKRKSSDDVDLARLCACESYTPAELDAFVLRLRLPESIANELRESLARFRRVCAGVAPACGLLDL